MFLGLKYTKQLEEAGFSRQQAEVQLKIISEIVEDDLVTKQDLKILENSVKSEFQALEANMKLEFQKLIHSIDSKFESKTAYLEQKINGTNNRIDSFENKFQQLEYRLTIKLGTMMIIGFTALVSILKFWTIH